MIHIEACALYFAWATSCWHGQCCFTGSDFPRGVFYYVLLRRLTTWRDEELPTLASPCKGRGERVASEAGPDNDTLLTPARGSAAGLARALLNPKMPRLQSRH